MRLSRYSVSATSFEGRAGRFIQQPTGYRAFVPAPLPPNPPLQLNDELLALLSEADRALGRLDGVTSVLPNPDLFIAMYVRQEAVLSSQIEGTQSTLEDVLEWEAGARRGEGPPDVEEVVNYVRAMNYGLERLQEFPLSLPLLQEIHGVLMHGVRGGQREPGEFRRSQNWIGAAGCTLQNATFVPPPVHEMKSALYDFEKWLHDGSLPVLLHCGLAHVQFETIHPFLDGNGRVGRLLMTFLLCHRGMLRCPLLYLSLYLKQHRAEYYDRLMAVRLHGAWEEWLAFLLRGIAQVSESATTTARSILQLRESGRARLFEANVQTGPATRLFDLLFDQPVITVSLVAERLGCTYPTAAALVAAFAKPNIGFLEQVSSGKRNRRFRFKPYMQLWEHPPGFDNSDFDNNDISPASAETSVRDASALAPDPGEIQETQNR